MKLLSKCITFAVCMSCLVSVQQAYAGSKAKLKVTSSAFEDGDAIPRKYSKEGSNQSPPLSWANAPKTTKSIVIICDDEDAPAGVWDHWVIYNILGNITSLDAGELPAGCVEGVNSWGREGYDGPFPPSGDGKHTYTFYVYALDSMVELESGATKKEVESVIRKKIIGKGELEGTYERD